MAAMTLDRLVEQLRAAFGDGLRTVLLYGSGAGAGEHIPKRSDLNVLVLVDSLDLELLEREAAIARAWGESGHPPPMTMTMDEWRSSSDIFPMEYADILDRHRVLYGTPPFEGIAVDRRDLRLQLEFQAMGKVLQLRQGILAAGGSRKQLIALLASSLSTFMVIFRAVLRARGEQPPTDNDALAAIVAERTGVDTSAFRRVVRHVRGAEPLTDKELHGVLAGYHAGAQQLVRYLDQAGHS